MNLSHSRRAAAGARGWAVGWVCLAWAAVVVVGWATAAVWSSRSDRRSRLRAFEHLDAAACPECGTAYRLTGPGVLDRVAPPWVSPAPGAGPLPQPPTRWSVRCPECFREARWADPGDGEGVEAPRWQRVAAFAFVLLLVGPLAALCLFIGRVMVRESEWYAAAVFLTLGGLPAWYVVGLGVHLARGQW